ncbi:PE-PGRS family protein [Streptomyces sp. NPDC017993]|uniref:PE-PGRS family protein n=1 Tax=Streptomyces sp. NPDC017993 TaxID=3365027 RepID=UPI00379413A3
MAFATVCVLLTALGHVRSSGAPLPWHVVVAAVASAAAGAWCFARRERGAVVVGLLTAGTQAVLHTAFAFGQVAFCGGAGRAPMHGMPRSPHEEMQGGGHSMVAVHMVVAALSAWWMWGGEQAVFRVVRTVSLFLFRRLLPAKRPVLPAVRHAARVPEQRPRRVMREWLLAHVVSLRGPPQAPAVR